MKTEDWKQVKVIIGEVLSLELTERQNFLKAANLNDQVRQEVESLLSFETEAEVLMQLPAVEFSKSFFEDGENAANVLIGQNIGAFRIVGELGHGGMGAVYLAERADGKFAQKVALKLLKREMNTAAVRRLFQHEREILASLEHPNIARLLDAGTTEDKIPFLVMEYVDGAPIDVYCKRHDLDLNARLELFRTICATVNFAHRNLVVHRDLKPSNILVTADGTPKLLDFGISKILSDELENTNAATITKMGVMTPSYASPEQLQGKSVTTATDVYSLGVILYELLSGQRPFEAQESDLKLIYQAVIEVEPPPPSALIGTETTAKTTGELIDKAALSETPTQILTSDHNTEPHKNRRTRLQTVRLSSHSLRGDLDNIVLKALRKEPERRYSSAENLSEDIRRHLAGLPVTARPNTFSYRAEKFIKRHSLGVFAAALIVLAILGGITATLWQARVAQNERARAERRFKDVRKLANSYLFDVYPQIENLEGSLKARQTILTNALEYLDSLANEAGNDVELQRELATAYEKVGDVQGALNTTSAGDAAAGLNSYQKARILRESASAANPKNADVKNELAQNYYITAKTLWNNNTVKESEDYFEKAVKLRRELVAENPGAAIYQNRLAIVLLDYGAIPAFNAQTEKAAVLHDEAIAILQKLLGENPDDALNKRSIARGLRANSKVKLLRADYDGALSDLNQSIAITDELLKQTPNDYRLRRTAWLNDAYVCELYIDKKDGENAVANCLKSIEFNRSVLEKEPDEANAQNDLSTSLFNTARAYRLSNNPASAAEYANKAVEVMSKLAAKFPDNLEYVRAIATYETEIGRALMAQNQPDKALENLQKAETRLAKVIADDEETATYRYDMAIVHRLSAAANYKKGERANAAADIDKAVAIVRRLAESKSLKESDKNLLAELETEKAEYNK